MRRLVMKPPFNKRRSGLLILIIAVCLFVNVVSVLAENSDEETSSIKDFAARKSDEPNPHLEFECTECHEHKPDRNYDTRETVDFKGGDIITTCYGCHDKQANLHPAGVVPSMKTPDHLPLDIEGKITCATCHNMHLKTVGNYILRGFTKEEGNLYEWRTDLCFDCHGENFNEKNPHRLQLEKQSCNFCHSSKPTEKDTAQTVQLRKDIILICSFCHNNVRKKNHPLNVDPTIKVPKELPRDASGRITCGTCHNPHGTARTIHFLREAYIMSLEEKKYVKPHYDKDKCTACHITRPSPDDTVETVDFRYNGNFIALCNSCHGLDADIHPVNIKPPPTMTVPPELPLDKDGKLTCVTCHEPQGVKPGTKLLRGKYKKRNDLCFRCHDREEFNRMNPHKDQERQRKCMYCHIVPPDRDIDDHESILTNIKGTIIMLCIRCHPDKPHPSNFNHLVRQTMIVPKQFPLDQEGGITCTTCHNPHLDPSKEKKLMRKGLDCNSCHVL